MQRKQLDAVKLRRLSVKYGVDPRSIQREAREPGSVRGMAGERAREALRDPMLATET